MLRCLSPTYQLNHSPSCCAVSLEDRSIVKWITIVRVTRATGMMMCSWEKASVPTVVAFRMSSVELRERSHAGSQLKGNWPWSWERNLVSSSGLFQSIFFYPHRKLHLLENSRVSEGVRFFQDALGEWTHWQINQCSFAFGWTFFMSIWWHLTSNRVDEIKGRCWGKAKGSPLPCLMIIGHMLLMTQKSKGMPFTADVSDHSQQPTSFHSAPWAPGPK